MRTRCFAAGGFALLAAVAFGVTTPLIQRFGKGAGAVPTAALLYAASSGAGCLTPTNRR